MIVRHKFNAKPTIVDNRKFASKKEAARYHELRILEAAGVVCFFLEQVPIRRKDGTEKYVVDFQIFWQNGTVTFEDVKGYKTPEYKRKKKWVELEYGIKIEEV